MTPEQLREIEDKLRIAKGWNGAYPDGVCDHKDDCSGVLKAEVHRLRAALDEKEKEARAWMAHSDAAEREAQGLREDRNDAYSQRDAALVKWHEHQKNVPCSGCEGGHDTFWKSVVESPQWEAWEKSNDHWDVDECRECGHISQDHFQAFMAFSVAAKDRTIAEQAAVIKTISRLTHFPAGEDENACGICVAQRFLNASPAPQEKPK